MSKKIFYISNIRIPTEKAHGIQVMEMCQAFAELENEVELIVPERKNDIKENPFTYYNVKESFRIKRLRCLDWVNYGRLGFWIESITFSLMALVYIARKEGIFYTRDEVSCAGLSLLNKKVVWEVHRPHDNFLTHLAIKRQVMMVAVTQGLKTFFLSNGATEDKIGVVPNGVRPEMFNIPKGRQEARRELGLEAVHQHLVMYIGHLYPWKGAEILAKAAAFLPESVKLVFVGGTGLELSEMERKYGSERVDFLGKQPHEQMPLYMRAADVLVLPNTSKDEISRLYTSPIKLFEYLASGTPVVSSDLPSIREIVNEHQVFFVEPDNPQNLAEGIKQLLSDPYLAESLAHNARVKADKLSWISRAKKILEYIATHD